MPNLEPTYLRYVYDSLNKGSLNAENASALPQGFIGLYEQEFAQKTPVSERKKVLNQLALWALFKGPVSANMAAAVLELEEEQMKDLVDRYSSWFNSPESGKYQLYHERLRVYLLQKLKAEEVQVLNEKLISFLEDAIKQAKGEEDEYYALEHLHNHMALESQLGNHYERLHSYVNQEILWRRQIQLSKGYAWSQNAVQQGIKEGARRDYEMNTIRSTVNNVKLMVQEQNSAEDILNLLNGGDYSTALKRAERWNGERQLKLYLLFIHELTIGKSKNSDYQLEACYEVLEAIGRIPVDVPAQFPIGLVYLYTKELIKIQQDIKVLWMRSDYNLSHLIPYEKENFNIIKDIINLQEDNLNKYRTCRNISEYLEKIGNYVDAKIFIEKSLCSVKNIPGDRIQDHVRYDYYSEIAISLIKVGQISKALKLVLEINDYKLKFNTYVEILGILISLQKNNDVKKIIKEFILINLKKTHELANSKTYINLSIILIGLGEVEQGINLISKITDKYFNCIAHIELYKLFIKQNQKDKAIKFFNQSVDFGTKINDLNKKLEVYKLFLQLLLEIDKPKEAKLIFNKYLDAIKEIKNDSYKKLISLKYLYHILIKYNQESDAILIRNKIRSSDSYNTDNTIRLQAEIDLGRTLIKCGRNSEAKEIYEALINEKQLEGFLKVRFFINFSDDLWEINEKILSKKFLDKSVKDASKVNDTRDRENAYQAIFYSCLGKGLIREAIEVISKFIDITKKSSAFSLISKRFCDEGDFQGALNIILESLNTVTSINNSWKEYHSYMSISEALARINHDKLSVRITEEIWDVWDQSDALINVGKVLIEKGKTKAAKKIFKKAYSIASSITDPEYRNRAYSNLCSEFIQNDMFTTAYNLSLEIIAKRGSTNLDLICKSFMDKGQKTKALEIASAINDKKTLVRVFSFFSITMAKKGHKTDAEKFIKESIKVASEIIDDNDRFKAYRPIINALVKQGKIKKSLRLISEIKNDLIESLVKKDLSTSLVKLGKTELALKIVEDIKDDYYKSRAYIDISKSLIDYGENLKVNEILVNLIRTAPNLGSRDQIEAYSDIFKILIDLGDIKGALKISTKIKNDRYQCDFYKKTSKVLLENGFLQNGMDFISKIKNGRNTFLKSLGVIIDSRDLNLITSKINSEYDKNIIIDSVSKKIMENYGSPDINQFTYNFHQNTQSLSNILYYQAKMACFFEKDRSEKKLNMLSEVLDIKDWRRISASA